MYLELPYNFNEKLFYNYCVFEQCYAEPLCWLARNLLSKENFWSVLLQYSLSSIQKRKLFGILHTEIQQEMRYWWGGMRNAVFYTPLCKIGLIILRKWPTIKKKTKKHALGQSLKKIASTKEMIILFRKLLLKVKHCASKIQN